MVKFSELEEKVLEYWKSKDIFAKTLAKPAPRGPFVFFEGPPTANAKPATHHLLARAFKDLIPRFKTMQGYRVDRKAGWDTQGLPVELQVEKELEFKGKPDIEKYGVAEFNAKCRADVWKFKEDWEKLTERMGFWLDLKHPYVTYENSYLESLWWIFKQVYEADLLYQGYKVLPHCPRCGTALSSHEVALGYKSVKDTAVYVKFKMRPGQKIGDFETDDKTYILSWTTTPWTLPGNVALAVGKDIRYWVRTFTKGEHAGNTYVFASERAADILKGLVAHGENVEVGTLGATDFVRHAIGTNLVGLQYEPLFNIPALQNENSHKVYAADFVTTTDGTGVVHTAVMYGEDDFNLGTQVGLPQHHTVDEAGLFTKDVPEFAGMPVKHKDRPTEDKTTEAIVQNLENREGGSLIFKKDLYEHDYPFCWRCSTPLLYYAKPSWFIKMSALREELTAANEKIHWYPEHIQHGRFGEWLDGVKDWAISRERYWGTPLPIWRCANTDCKHVLVVGSLKELGEKSGRTFPANFDLHRPFIDEVQFKCLTCGEGLMKRVPEVADCWFDSGSMPYAQWGYPHVPGSAEQLASHYPANYIAEAIDQTRGWFYTLLAVSVLVKKTGAIAEVPPYQNVICLGHINDAKGQKMSKSKGNIVDPWEMINRFGVDAIRFYFYTANQPGEPKNFDTAALDEVTKKTFLILMNVLTFYELYRGEVKAPQAAPEVEHVMDRWVLALLQQLVNDVTRHLENYEVTEAGRKIAEFVTELSTWYVRRSRDRFKDENARPAALYTLGYALATLAKLMAPFTPFVAEEVYSRASGLKESVHLEEWPEAVDSAEQSLLTDMTKLRQVIELGLAQRADKGFKIRQPLGQAKITGLDIPPEFYEILKEELNVKSVHYASAGELGIAFDFTMTEELKAEGLVREFCRQVNVLRKAQKLTIQDKVEFIVAGSKEVVNVLQQQTEEIMRATLASEVGFSDKPQEHEVDLGEAKVTVSIKR